MTSIQTSPMRTVRFVHLHRAVAKKCGGSRGSTVRFLQCLHRMLGKLLSKVLFEGFGRVMVSGVASLMSSDGVVKSCKFLYKFRTLIFHIVDARLFSATSIPTHHSDLLCICLTSVLLSLPHQKSSKQRLFSFTLPGKSLKKKSFLITQVQAHQHIVIRATRHCLLSP